MSLGTAVARIRREVRLWILVLKDPRTLRLAKRLLGAALAYLASSADVVPDFIPALG
jgi:uncharacterized membrane protein YkvA (DUF1232 family)